MAQGSLLSDELLRQLIAAGQVDILVGIPTFNNASSVERAIRAVHVSFATHFQRDRTVMLNSDGGSEDGTRELVRNAALADSETLVASHALRTVHRISAPYHGLPGKGNAVRTIFAAAELLQAKAVAVLDPDVTTMTPEWIASLVRPAYREGFDFVAPLYPRHPFDGAIVTQINRPLVRAAYGHRLAEPVGGEFGCSGRFASHCLAQDVWESSFARFGIDPWLAGTAMAGGFRVCQTLLGPRLHGPKHVRPGLPEVFQQVVGSLFECLGMHQSYWLSRDRSEPVTTFGNDVHATGEPHEIDPAPMAESFRAGVRDLAPVLEQILARDTLSELRRVAEGDLCSVRYDDDLWVETVYEFAASHHHSVMHREHLVLALVPLYLGRLASFVMEHATCDEQTIDRRFEALGQQYERSKPHLVERWNPESGR